ncbi:MAG TPA: hypothetical protein VM287_00070 [Egibacteraceae bacterium]|nr:hypothetical protein [Egibacteraceae bacterium]
MPLEERIDELFALPPDAFTAARDALVTELRAAGDRDGAIRVKGLRKPTIAAWALNEVARRDPSGLRRLREAGEELARAQRRVVSGLDPAALRAAQQRRWQVAAGLLAQALEVLREAGVPPDPHADAVRGGLDAAALDAELGEAVAEGRLSRPPQAPSGFAGLSGLTAVPSEAEEPEPDHAEAGADERLAEARLAEARLAEARQQRDAAASDARATRREAVHAAEDAERVAKEVGRLERKLSDARNREKTAIERARSAAERAQDAEAILARRQELVAEAQAALP